MLLEPRVSLYTVEMAFAERDFQVTTPGNDHDIRVIGNHELWAKENLINIGLSKLPAEAKYIAWIDADITFTNPHWVDDTLNALQHHPVVQLWSHAVDMGPKGEIMQTAQSFGYRYQQVHGDVDQLVKDNFPGQYESGGIYPHSGFAWAATRETLSGLGGLLDWGICGAADFHMAWAMVGRVEVTRPDGVSENYKTKLLDFQSRADNFVKENVGYVPGTIAHYFHGSKKKRKYLERWEILIKHNYRPDVDIVKDIQGLYHFSHGRTKLQSDMRHYFLARDEDGTEI
jgi:hypothetical protein